MKIIGVRDLKNNISRYLNDIGEEGGVIITNHGNTCAALIPLSDDDLEDFVLAHSPRIQKAVRRGQREVARGKSVSLEELLAETGKKPSR